MTKQNNAYFLSHNGLGDNITNIGAINYLVNYYNNVYMLCKDIHKDNVQKFFSGNVIVIAYYTNNDMNNNEVEECRRILDSATPDSDMFISGYFNDCGLRSRITHPVLLSYIKNDKGYSCYAEHIRKFYYDINMDLSIYYEYFNIHSSEVSVRLLSLINSYKIIFIHTRASNREIDISHIINNYINNHEYIIVCANKNVYNQGDSRHELANLFVNIPIAHYIDVIKNSSIIHVVDSCFSCIVLPLKETNRLKAGEICIHSR